MIGTKAAKQLSGSKGTLNTVFAAMIVVVALYTLYKSWVAMAA